MELIFHEDGYLVKTLDTSEELDASMRLREEVFSKELKWVPPSPNGMDRDKYDDFAHSIGIFNNQNNLVGHVRLINAPNPYMIEKEFACLLSKGKAFKKLPDMVESTRICIEKNSRSAKTGNLTLGHLLYKAIYNWCFINDVRFLVTIIEKRYYRYLKSLFPFEPLGDFIPLGDGVLSGVVLLDWRRFDSLAKERKPDFFEWITDYQPSLRVVA